MADFSTLQAGTLDSVPGVTNVFDNSIRVGADGGSSLDTHGRVSVQILASNGNTVNEFDKVVPVGINGSFERKNLIGERGVPPRRPKAEKKGGFSFDGSGNSLDRVAGSPALLGGVRVCAN
jgi:hypothetical protein